MCCWQSLLFSRYVLGWRSMPEFIMDFIWENQLFRVLFIIILIGLNYLFILCLFVLPSVILYKKDFRASWQECFVLLRKRKAATLWKFVVSFTVLLLSFFSFFFRSRSTCSLRKIRLCPLPGRSRLSFPDGDSGQDRDHFSQYNQYYMAVRHGPLSVS